MEKGRISLLVRTGVRENFAGVRMISQPTYFLKRFDSLTVQESFKELEAQNTGTSR